ncbi:hypothetical protein EVAR_23715_1 [Eumeta japonica]|uniref:Ig-like domain-containing protein n=1 Tax=Eumeta variegata TaxID=151549 RepID=A0A4C1VHA3_EUMVA|nr:hypothetical protein EVAR_23715_1 [Eumeta japonica]
MNQTIENDFETAAKIGVGWRLERRSNTFRSVLAQRYSLVRHFIVFSHYAHSFLEDSIAAFVRQHRWRKSVPHSGRDPRRGTPSAVDMHGPISMHYGGSEELLLMILMASVEKSCRGLSNVQLSAPTAVRVGDTVTLGCSWTLDDNETLYSVKWYRGRQEFFSYLPKEFPETRIFAQPGIEVDGASGAAKYHDFKNDDLKKPRNSFTPETLPATVEDEVSFYSTSFMEIVLFRYRKLRAVAEVWAITFYERPRRCGPGCAARGVRCRWLESHSSPRYKFGKRPRDIFRY